VTVHHVIVGNSIAGVEAALAIRRRDADARITLVSGEHAHPFARVSLMYVLCGQLSLRDTELHGRDLYERMRFERVHGWVRRVDPTTRTLHLDDGATVGWDRLLLAVGSRARRLPGTDPDDPAVHHFVRLEDLERLDRAAVRGRSVAVVGGGLIGVEVAEALHARGLRVHFLIREPWYFPVALDGRESEVVAAHIRGHGVDVRTRCAVSGVEPVGEKRRLRLPDGPLDVDLVVAAVGVEPATGFLAGSGVAVHPQTGGVEVGDDLRSSSTPDVVAAGDCAQVAWADGSRRPEQLWYTARDQGRVAGLAMVGDEVRYRRGTWYNSAKFFDLEYTTAGWIPASHPGAQVPPSEGWTTWYQADGVRTLRVVCKDGVVKGFNALGARWDHTVWLRWIQERRALAWVLPRLAESHFHEELDRPFLAAPTATLTEGA